MGKGILTKYLKKLQFVRLKSVLEIHYRVNIKTALCPCHKYLLW